MRKQGKYATVSRTASNEMGREKNITKLTRKNGTHSGDVLLCVQKQANGEECARRSEGRVGGRGES